MTFSKSTSADRSWVEITLERDIDEEYKYEPGETLRGIVKVHSASKQMKVKFLRVQLYGAANVSWEQAVPRRPDIVDTYEASEKYLETDIVLLEPATGQKYVFLEQKESEYPFEAQLPHDIPSSYLGRHGSVTYVVKASLQEDNPLGMGTLICSEPFLVLKELDLAQFPDMLERFDFEDTKKVRGFIGSGKVIVKGSLNRRAFMPGEDIHVELDVTNKSRRTIEAVQAAIVMSVTFRAKNQRRTTTQTINRLRDDCELGSGAGWIWSNERLTVPSYVAESKLQNCNIIDLTYDVVFTLESSGSRKHDMVFAVPLIIGSHGVDVDYANIEPDEERLEKFATVKEFKTGRSKLDKGNAVEGGGYQSTGFIPALPDEEKTRENPLHEQEPDDIGVQKEYTKSNKQEKAGAETDDATVPVGDEAARTEERPYKGNGYTTSNPKAEERRRYEKPVTDKYGTEFRGETRPTAVARQTSADEHEYMTLDDFAEEAGDAADKEAASANLRRQPSGEYTPLSPDGASTSALMTSSTSRSDYEREARTSYNNSSHKARQDTSPVLESRVSKTREDSDYTTRRQGDYYRERASNYERQQGVDKRSGGLKGDYGKRYSAPPPPQVKYTSAQPADQAVANRISSYQPTPDYQGGAVHQNARPHETTNGHTRPADQRDYSSAQRKPVDYEKRASEYETMSKTEYRKAPAPRAPTQASGDYSTSLPDSSGRVVGGAKKGKAPLAPSAAQKQSADSTSTPADQGAAEDRYKQAYRDWQNLKIDIIDKGT